MRWPTDAGPGRRGGDRDGRTPRIESDRQGPGPRAASGISAAICLGAAAVWAISAVSGAAQDDAPDDGPAYTAQQAERGQAVYREHCLSCHGSSLRGGANEFAAPALAGPFFFDAWGGRPVAELLAYSAENMPPEGSLLPEPDYVDVTAYILQVLGYPEGDTELTADSPALAGGIERQR